MKRSFLTYILIVHSLLLGCAALCYIGLSGYGTHARSRLQERADAVFAEEWTSHQRLPQDLPLQQLIVVGASGEIEHSSPHRLTGSAEDFIEAYNRSPDPDFLTQLTSALGNWLEPLVDRYPFIGRSPTFLLKSYSQHDGTTVSVALWLPLPTRLIWASYAALVYLFLTHWPLSVLWVYTDARRKRVYPWRWVMFTALASIVGLLACVTTEKLDRSRKNAYSCSNTRK